MGDSIFLDWKSKFSLQVLWDVWDVWYGGFDRITYMIRNRIV